MPPGRDPGGVAVGFLGPGLDYRLPALARRLARDGEGDIVGWDFVDQDQRPFDAAGSGSELAELLLSEAPAARLVPVRFLPGDPRGPAQALVLLSRTRAEVALLLAASSDAAHWGLFAEALHHFADRLLIAPAGGDVPPFPVALALPRVLAVTTAGAGAAAGGPRGGVAVAAPGPAAAAARVAALAARLQAAEPGLRGAALETRLRALATPLVGGAGIPVIGEAALRGR